MIINKASIGAQRINKASIGAQRQINKASIGAQRQDLKPVLHEVELPAISRGENK